MKRNKRLLLKAAKRIEEIPQSYDQTTFVEKDADSPCGTRACLAGEIIIAAERTAKTGALKLLRMRGSVPMKAAKLVGLDYREAGRLFETGYGLTWPDPFKSQFDKARGPKSRAKVAAALLRYLCGRWGGLTCQHARPCYPDTDTGADFEIMLRNPQRMKAIPFKYTSRGRIARIKGS